MKRVQINQLAAAHALRRLSTNEPVTRVVVNGDEIDLDSARVLLDETERALALEHKPNLNWWNRVIARQLAKAAAMQQRAQKRIDRWVPGGAYATAFMTGQNDRVEYKATIEIHLSSGRILRFERNVLDLDATRKIKRFSLAAGSTMFVPGLGRGLLWCAAAGAAMWSAAAVIRGNLTVAGARALMTAKLATGSLCVLVPGFGRMVPLMAALADNARLKALAEIRSVDQLFSERTPPDQREQDAGGPLTEPIPA